MVKNCTEQRKYGKRRCSKSYSQIWEKSDSQPTDAVKKDVGRLIHEF